VALRRQIDSLRRGDSAGAGTSLQAQLNTQRSILAETRLRYSEDHPDVKKLERSIKGLEARLASGEQSDSSANVRTPAVLQLETQANATGTQIAALQQHAVELRTKLEGLQGRLSSTPEVEREYETLTRDAGTAHQQYDQIVNKRMQAEVSSAEISGGTADKFALIAKPIVPSSASSPKRLGIALIGLFGAALLALMAAIGATSVDPTVRGSRDILELLKVSPIGIVPVIRNAAFHRRRMRQLTLALAGVGIAVPTLVLLTRIIFR
jgi:polysaccharide biosynthesis transport protein